MKTVNKIWGYENIYANNDLYCLKFLILNKGSQCSMHFHKQKDETFLISKGKVMMEHKHKTLIMTPGDTIRIRPTEIHRFLGIQDSIIIEISTKHKEKDTVRLEPSKKRKICYIDIDGFLCTDHKGIYRKGKPLKNNIDKINKKYEKDFIILWTARGITTHTDWKNFTEKQLKKWNVKYHDLSFDKPYYDEIWDDKCRK